MSVPAAINILALRIPESHAVEKAVTTPVAATPSPTAPTQAIALLTRKLASGDEAAFREFHEEYFDRLYRFLLVICRGNEEECKEALQATLLRVARYVRKFDSEEIFWSWLTALARSAARDAGRKQQRYAVLMQNFAATSASAGASALSDEETQLSVILRENLEELDLIDREIIEGKYLAGLTVKELSNQTGLTEKAVESRLARARRHLRAEMLKTLQSRT